MDSQADSGKPSVRRSRSDKGKALAKQQAPARASKETKYETITWKEGQMKLVLEREEERELRKAARKKAKEEEGKPRTPRRRSSRLLSLKSRMKGENDGSGEMTLIVLSSSSSEGELIFEEEGEVSWDEASA